MEHSHNHDAISGNGESWLFSRTGVATLVAVSVLGFLIYEGHGAHLLGALPYLLILSCPLMHIFMHGGHGGHGGHQHGGNEEENTPAQQQAANTQQSNATQQDKQHQHKRGCH